MLMYLLADVTVALRQSDCRREKKQEASNDDA